MQRYSRQTDIEQLHTESVMICTPMNVGSVRCSAGPHKHAPHYVAKHLTHVTINAAVQKSPDAVS